jgi:hypothetical protein
LAGLSSTYSKVGWSPGARRAARRGIPRRCCPVPGWAARAANSTQNTGPDADHAVHADLPAHQLDQLLGDHEPDAGAFFAAVVLAEAVERLEQLRKLVRRQAGAGVPDADAHAIRAAVAHWTITLPPMPLYLIAFDSRLIMTCLIRVRSACT